MSQNQNTGNRATNDGNNSDGERVFTGGYTGYQGGNTGTYNTGNTGSTYTGGNTGNTAATGSSGTYSNQATGATSGTSGNYGATTTTGTAPIRCWTCRNAYSYAQCEAEGTLVTCQESQKSCELEVRERNGNVIQVNTGCKQAMACENNKAQNFQGNNPAQTQCRPEPGYTHSVCRQCCYDDSCVSSPDFWKPASREEWAY